MDPVDLDHEWLQCFSCGNSTLVDLKEVWDTRTGAVAWICSCGKRNAGHMARTTTRSRSKRDDQLINSRSASPTTPPYGLNDLIRADDQSVHSRGFGALSPCPGPNPPIGDRGPRPADTNDLRRSDVGTKRGLETPDAVCGSCDTSMHPPSSDHQIGTITRGPQR